LGDPDRMVRKIAVCTGAGSDFLPRAADAGADLYLTAEVKHHHALEAAQRGLAVVEADHFTLERVMWPGLKDRLEGTFPGQLDVRISQREQNPWIRYQA
jgi:putative NIF3 family GTP cyclohydrolase 1 type 2